MKNIYSKHLLVLAAFCCLFFTTQTAGANEKPRVYIILNKDETLDSISKKILARYKNHYPGSVKSFRQDLTKWNPHITNWDSLPAKTRLYVEHPFPVHVPHGVAAPIAKAKAMNEIDSVPSLESSPEDKRFRLFGMVTASLGNFNQSVSSEDAEIKSTQNSPISLGLGANFFLNNKNHIATSAYWSKLNSSSVSGLENLGEINSDPEIGFNLYYQHHFQKGDFALYGGVDYEQFSSFDFDKLINSSALVFQKNTMVYGTIGLGKNFELYNRNLLFKISYAKSISSSSDSSDSYEGSRILFFTSYQASKRFSYNLLYKRHMLEAKTELTVDRVGIGFSYLFF